MEAPLITEITLKTPKTRGIRGRCLLFTQIEHAHAGPYYLITKYVFVQAKGSRMPPLQKIGGDFTFREFLRNECTLVSRPNDGMDFTSIY